VADDPLLVYIRKLGIDSTNTWVSMTGSAWQILADASGNPGGAAPGVSITDLSTTESEPGLFRVSGLSTGPYWLTETQALDGFALLAAPIRFVVDADGSVTLCESPGAGTGTDCDSSVADTSTSYPENAATGTLSYPVIQVKDVPNVTLPEAGGPGLGGFWRGGSLALALALGLELRRRWRSRGAGQMHE